MTWAFGHEIDTKRTKFQSREHTTTLEVSEDASPFSFKISNSIRQNSVAMASLGFMKYEAMPTLKQSLSVEYNDTAEDFIRKGSLEVALPTSLFLDN
jgi:hypothetical protein